MTISFTSIIQQPNDKNILKNPQKVEYRIQHYTGMPKDKTSYAFFFKDISNTQIKKL